MGKEMIPRDLATYSDWQLERLARETLESRPDVEHFAPINIEWLLEGLLDFAGIEYAEGLCDKHLVEGMVLKHVDGHRELLVRIDLGIFRGPWPHYNKVLCEEFAHIIIHAALFLYVHSEEDFFALQRDPQWARHEKDARRFVDAIMMPCDLLGNEASQLYPAIVDEHGFGDTLSIYGLLISKLASRFRVTTSDMRRRLQQSQVGLEDRLLSSLQTRNSHLLPVGWSAEAKPQYVQSHLFDKAIAD